MSDIVILACGVPQGSILGPLLLIINYIKTDTSIFAKDKILLYFDKDKEDLKSNILTNSENAGSLQTNHVI